MAVDLGLWLVLVANVAILIGGAAIAVFVFRRGGEAQADDETGASEWYVGVRSLAREVGHTVEAFDRPVDADRVSRRLLPLANRIQGHVRAAPDDVDEAIYRQLFELGVGCQRIAVEHRPARIAFEDEHLGKRLAALRNEADALEAQVAPET